MSCKKIIILFNNNKKKEGEEEKICQSHILKTNYVQQAGESRPARQLGRQRAGGN